MYKYNCRFISKIIACVVRRTSSHCQVERRAGNMYSLKDKVVLITGAANGIGAVLSNEVLKEGAKHVRILDVDENAGIQLQNELNKKYGANKAKFAKCDVTNDDQLFGAFDNTKQEQGYLDVVVNNAGVSNESSYAAIRNQIQINFIALVNGTLKAMEMMDKSKGGRGGTVINIASVAGMFPVCPPIFTYSSTKSAVLQFTSCIGVDPFHSDTGVRVVALCFGSTDTSLFDSMVTFQGRADKQLKEIVDVHPKQSVEAAAEGFVAAFKTGKSSSIWLIRNNKPARDITENREKCHAQMAELLG